MKLNFKEWLIVQEMGYFYDPKDDSGVKAVVTLPSLSSGDMRLSGGQSQCTDLDMRFEDYGFPGSNYFPWYAELPSGQIISSYDNDHRLHADEKSFQAYRTKADQNNNRPVLWKQVPKSSPATAMAQEQYGFDKAQHSWWDFAEGSTNNRVVKPGLYRIMSQRMPLTKIA